MTQPVDPSSDVGKPGFLDRLRARMPWLDHVVRAQQRYNDSKGDFYAAGITYFTIFAMFPVLMVGFAAGGFVLAGRPDLLDEVEKRIRAVISGDLGQQIIQLMDSAIASRTSVGIIGLATAAWAGLGWMNNLREALSQMWGTYRGKPPGFVKTKLSDLVALLSAFLAIIVTIALTALGNTSVMESVLHWIGIRDTSALSAVLQAASLVMSLLVSWLLFTWMIARLPRESVSFRSSVRAGLIAAVGFEIFKQVAAHLPAVGRHRPRRGDVRSGAGPDGVRLHHRAAVAVRDGVGGHREGQPARAQRGSPPAAPARGHQHPGDHPPGSGSGPGGRRGDHGSLWRPESFTHSTAQALSSRAVVDARGPRPWDCGCRS